MGLDQLPFFNVSRCLKNQVRPKGNKIARLNFQNTFTILFHRMYTPDLWANEVRTLRLEELQSQLSCHFCPVHLRTSRCLCTMEYDGRDSSPGLGGRTTTVKQRFSVCGRRGERPPGGTQQYLVTLLLSRLGWRGLATGILWVETMGAAKCPTMHGTDPHTIFHPLTPQPHSLHRRRITHPQVAGWEPLL